MMENDVSEVRARQGDVEMAKSKAVAAVRYFEERLKSKNVSVSKIILFGSQARGNASSESSVCHGLVFQRKLS
jgi:predicted nucleotidyltransferase